MKTLYINLFTMGLLLSITSCQTKKISYYDSIVKNDEQLFMQVYAKTKNKKDEKLRRQKVDELKKIYIANLIGYFQAHPECSGTVQFYLESYNKLCSVEEERRKTGIRPDPKNFFKDDKQK